MEEVGRVGGILNWGMNQPMTVVMTPFPTFHRRANEAAETKRDEARAHVEESDAFLEDLDSLLGGSAEPAVAHRRKRGKARV